MSIFNVWSFAQIGEVFKYLIQGKDYNLVSHFKN